MGGAKRAKHWRCSCVTCLRFRLEADRYGTSRIPTNLPRSTVGKLFVEGVFPFSYKDGICGICGRSSKREAGSDYPARPLLLWIPEIIAEFFQTDSICNCCRNVIVHFLEEWHVCLSNSSDETIKWCLVAAYYGHWWKMHIVHSGIRWSGVYVQGGFEERECCKTGVSHARRNVGAGTYSNKKGRKYK